MSNARHKPCSASHARPPGRLAFTLVEMMAVVAIIVLLLGIAVPSISKVRMNIMRQATLSVLAIISNGCEAYKVEQGSYPPSGQVDSTHMSCGGDYEGREWLVQSLVGNASNDGVNGYGYRYLHFNGNSGNTGPNCPAHYEAYGRTYAPYNGCEKLDMVRTGSNWSFSDSFQQPIYYYRFDKRSGVESYFAVDNSGGPSGTTGMPAYTQNTAGAYFRTDYVLMSKGPNGVWDAYRDNPRTDDCTNFLPEN